MSKYALKQIILEYFARKYMKICSEHYHVDVVTPKTIVKISTIDTIYK
jgi:hypothetical protein